MRNSTKKTEPAAVEVYTDDTLMPNGKYEGVPLKEVPAGHLLGMVESGSCRNTKLLQYIHTNLDTLLQEYKQFKK